MKIAVIYNRESQKVINLFGIANREKYGLVAIQRIVNALKQGGHQVVALEGDKDLIDKLEEFMPRVLKGERPGMAFNLSYGIQGQARYTHVPGILEMVGLPYVGSGPLAHSLALDKVVAKMIFVQHGIPTPQFAVLKNAGFDMPSLSYPMIVKPKNESVSFGIKIVHNEKELREAADVIFKEFGQHVLVEQYIDGKEINVGLLGNSAHMEAFPPAELEFGDGPKIYTLEDKKRQSNRTVEVVCPARIDKETAKRAQQIAMDAFEALGCNDCARIDMRMDKEGNLYVLEINSLPSLGEHGTYVAAADVAGLDFTALVNRLVEVAASRYFGTPHPPDLAKKTSDPKQALFGYLSGRRDQLEQSIEAWTRITSRSDDTVGIRAASAKFGQIMHDVGLKTVKELTDSRDVWTWETQKGIDGGTLLIVHTDIPVTPSLGAEHFRRDPEWLYGEGIGTSRGPLIQVEYALRAMKSVKKLRLLRAGVLCYADEGNDCEQSADMIAKACERASNVIVLTPGNLGGKVITKRRGQRKYQLTLEGKSLRLGQSGRDLEVMRVLYNKLNEISSLTNKKARVGVSAIDIRTEAYPFRLPHRAHTKILVSYPNAATAKKIETEMRSILANEGIQWDLVLVSDRPPFIERKENKALFNRFAEIGKEWDVHIEAEASLWPSVAGLVPAETPVLCGVGPEARDLYTTREAVSRMSLIQRTLLLSEFLLHTMEM